jgi:hypothetical protein
MRELSHPPQSGYFNQHGARGSFHRYHVLLVVVVARLVVVVPVSEAHCH